MRSPRIALKSVQLPTGLLVLPKNTPQTGKPVKILINTKNITRVKDATRVVMTVKILEVLSATILVISKRIETSRINPKVPTSKL